MSSRDGDFQPVNVVKKRHGGLIQKFVKYGAEARRRMRKCELLLPEIDRREIWKRKGFGSIYEYAAKLAGMSHEKVRECLRIHHHIEDKPELMEVAEKQGLFSVQPVATIATREDAGFWAEKAASMPKNVLEKYTQSYRRQSVTSDTSQPEKVKISLMIRNLII